MVCVLPDPERVPHDHVMGVGPSQRRTSQIFEAPPDRTETPAPSELTRLAIREYADVEAVQRALNELRDLSKDLLLIHRRPEHVVECEGVFLAPHAGRERASVQVRSHGALEHLTDLQRTHSAVHSDLRRVWLCR